MSAHINVVVTCTKRKLLPVAERLEFRGCSGRSTRERAKRWIGRLASTKSESTPAHAVYAGDHWATVRSFPEAARKGGLRPKIWILSAGYGLIAWDAPIKAYSATFSADHPDSVCPSPPGQPPVVARNSWWEALSAWEGPQPGAPRTLTELAQSDPKTPLLVVASNVYLSAVQPDLMGARNALKTHDLLSIVSAGCDTLGQLTDHLIPADARLKHLLGGGMQSLNVRIARKILGESDRWAPRCATLTKRFKGLLSRQKDFVQPQRTPMSDGEVRTYVRKALKKNPTLTRSPLLRLLRDSGRACEQKRFGGLFLEAAAALKQVHKQETIFHGT